ncbi:MAG: M81 family metallopeptidase [Acetobacterales bacterium]
MAKIAVGGIQHETNTFMAGRTDYEYFEEHRDRPPLVRGPEVLSWLKGASLGLSGFIDAMEGRHELVPTVWAGGGAGATVTEHAFERIASELIDLLSRQMPVDAVYLDQHGAMVTENYEDGDAELLRRVRAAVGPDVPVVASLDYHSNVSPDMVAHADALVAYRTYPHVDRPQTGARAARVVETMLARGIPKGKALRKLPYLVASHQQPTVMEPTATVIRLCEEGEGDTVVNLSYLSGFRLSDTYDCGLCVVANAYTQEAANAAVGRIASYLAEHEGTFGEPMLEPDTCAAKAMEIAAQASKPVLICDPQDNPGGGGSGDTTGMLAALVKARAQKCVVGPMHDPEAAKVAHAAGKGASITVNLGGKTRFQGVEPFHGTFEVVGLGDGIMTTTGPAVGGRKVELGPMAALRIGGVTVLVVSKRVQANDQSYFRHVGIEPKDQKILGLKSAVHFRADFGPLAETILVIKAPGGCPADPTDLPYKRLKPGTRLGPLGPEYRPYGAV